MVVKNGREVKQELEHKGGSDYKTRTRDIRFLKGLPQGDALCPRLFTVCLNPIASKISASKGYKLSKLNSANVRDL